jgi:hypothetical protein
MAVFETILATGPASNRVDIVFAGDGYQASEIDTTYAQHVGALVDYLFSGDILTQPFGRYENFFNVHKVDVVSAQSGADDPTAGVFRDTALDATYLFDGVTQRLLYVSNAKAGAAIAGALAGSGITADMAFITVNDTQYGGGGGLFAVYAGGNFSAREVAVHEVGHSFAGLADEYGGDPTLYVGGEPFQPNVTTDPTGAKWAAWLGYDQPGIGIIGAYEGGLYHDLGIWRPSLESKMRVLGEPFDAIAREQFIQKIYAEVRPLDSWTDNTTVLVDSDTLAVTPVDPQIIKVRWSVDGQMVQDGTTDSFDLSDAGFGAGTYSVTALAYDDTDWVRGSRDALQESITWTVQVAEMQDAGGRPEKRGHMHGHDHDDDHHRPYHHAGDDWMI